METVSCGQLLQGRFIAQNQSGSVQFNPALALESAKCAADGLPGRADQLRHLVVRERQFYADRAVLHAAIGGPLHQEARQLFRSRVVQTDGADYFIGGAAVAAQVLCDVQTGLAMFLDESKETFAADVGHLAGLQRFCGNLMRRAGKNRVQPEDFTGLRDFQDDDLPSLLVLRSFTRPWQRM
jgi:hypothetical protein